MDNLTNSCTSNLLVIDFYAGIRSLICLDIHIEKNSVYFPLSVIVLKKVLSFKPVHSRVNGMTLLHIGIENNFKKIFGEMSLSPS